MGYTGKLIIIKEDTNPRSSTYGQKITEKEDSDLCFDECNMQLVDSYYDEEVGANFETYRDVNSLSNTFGQSVNIEQDSTDAVLLKHTYSCEQVLYNETAYGNSGKATVKYIDANPNSPTYQTYTEVFEDCIECSLPDKSPVVEINQYCETTLYPTGVYGNTGKIKIEITDTNPYSDTYDQLIYSDEQLADKCRIPDLTPKIITICSYCEFIDGVYTGKRFSYKRDVNKYSSGYNTEPKKYTEVDSTCGVKKNVLTGESTSTVPVKIKAYTNSTLTNISADVVDGSFLYKFSENQNFNRFVFDDSTCKTITSIDFSLCTLNIIKGDSMFSNCTALKEVVGLDLNGVTSLYNIYYGCTSMEEATLNCENATNISTAFVNCTSLKKATVFSKSVTSLNATFRDCSSLEKIVFDGCDFSNLSLSTLYPPLSGCDSLTEISAYGCNDVTIEKIRQMLSMSSLTDYVDILH